MICVLFARDNVIPGKQNNQTAWPCPVSEREFSTYGLSS